MNCEKACRRITAGAFLAIIGVCLVLILGQFVIKNVFIEIFGMDNAITDMSVTGGSDGMISVDWEGLYPFSDKEENTVQETEDTLVDIYVNKVRSVTNVIDMYSDDYLPFKENMKIPSGLFDRIIGNKMVDRALDIKPTIKIKEGTEIKLITNTPLELPPVEVFQATQKYVRTRK